MNVAVTGASGFIGAALVRALSLLGHHVTAVSRTARDGSPEGLVLLPDYRDTPPGEVLFHLGESASVADAEVRGDAGVRERAELCRALAGRFQRVVYVSSGVVYGDADERPRRPTDPVVPAGAYARGKLAAEAEVLARGGLVVRLANVYGPRMAPDTVVADVVRGARGPGPLRVRDTAPVRDFLWLQDCVDGLCALEAAGKGGVFNLGSGVGTPIGELARLALELCGGAARGVIASQPSARRSTLVLDIEDTTRACGFRPRVELRAGLSALLGVTEQA